MDSGLEGQERIPRIAHLENSPESILCQIPNLQYLQVRRDTPQIQLVDDNIIDDDRRLRRLIEGRCEHFLRARIEVRIGSQRRPVEVEGHIAMTLGRRYKRGEEMEMSSMAKAEKLGGDGDPDDGVGFQSREKPPT